MAGLIDTNILLYAANRDIQEHTPAVRFLVEAGRSSDTWYLTEGILYEFFRVSTHPRIFPRPLGWREALSFLHPFLHHPTFAVLSAGPRHWGLLEKELATLTHPSGNLFFDVRTVVIMRENGLRTLYSADTDFLQFSDITVVNPLTTP